MTLSRHECQQLPELVPVMKPVSVKLPQPEETCIIKQVLLPRVECQQVKERRCMVVPEVQDGPEVKIDKCSVEVRENIDHLNVLFTHSVYHVRLENRPAVMLSCSCPGRSVPPRWSPPTSG